MNRLFSSATLKLTGWYLLILMLTSLLFSTILFQISKTELQRSLQAPRGPIGYGLFMDSEAAQILRAERYQDGVARLLGNLITFNVTTLIIGGGVSYMLARRTLKPIQETMEAQSRFTSDASHELRTPLTVMQSEIEVGLRDSKATKVQYRELLESNLDEVHRLRELSDRLLLLASERELPLATASLDSIAIDATSHVIKTAQAKHISVENNVKPLEVRANHEALADVITILLDNAIKYSPEKTTITLSAEEKPKSILLHVIDQGQGIAEKDLAHIYERFYRVDDSRSRQHVEGHGLGLSIAERIMEQHGGQVSVTSTEGKGSTFTLRLPRA